MIYETVIVPGEGLGNHITLGDSMFNIIKQLSNANYKLKISYSDTDFLNVPVVVTVVKLGIRLTFRNQREQTLDLIELLDLAIDGPVLASSGVGGANSVKRHQLLKIIYKNVSLNEFENSELLSSPLMDPETNNSSSSSIAENSSSSSSTTLTSVDSKVFASSKITLKLIYNRIFGPTYPGKLISSSRFYVLSYPGVSFKFKILSEDLFQKVAPSTDSDPQEQSKVDESILSSLLNWDKPEEIVCDSIALYKGNSWNDFDLKGIMDSRGPDWFKQSEIAKLLINLDEGKTDICFGRSGARDSSVEATDVASLIIGHTTQQEVLNILGPPDDYFNKSDSRLLIHDHLPFLKEADSTNVIEQDISHYKFHNYFRYGIDILYDLNNTGSHIDQNSSKTVIKKIIVHNGGITESLSFMKWNRCNWEMTTTLDGRSVKIDSTMYLKDFPEQIRNLAPVLLNRNESEFIDNDLDIIQLPQPSNGHARTNNEYSNGPKVKTWGQSKLHGLDRCIFEAVDSSGCISSVTIY
ncbi:uncharacterized protein CANTADRAFT_57004 [Suhomyces tanzawaensis NRRL Y-17324]|uniref:Uncharacterized protein n=1 Tax=Suhomyces tanzawaensis NRRL Y-17324 TaxID=984487 RepID=A0A1E4SC26_9ASCO|nr:uncharacterized protein CANTADRAFT_57004 [Suhomyces tanzawaensis NRRL Y-17324]ODV76942.1 hypothetical protein CANTADRAFT_57004 [Suhomyces tanzawaensis NRRL Y-17324]